VHKEVITAVFNTCVMMMVVMVVMMMMIKVMVKVTMITAVLTILCERVMVMVSKSNGYGARE
jgi:hypothetical protein